MSSEFHIHSKFTATTYRSYGLHGRKCQTAAPKLVKERTESDSVEHIEMQVVFLYRFRFAMQTYVNRRAACKLETKLAALARLLFHLPSFLHHKEPPSHIAWPEGGYPKPLHKLKRRSLNVWKRALKCFFLPIRLRQLLGEDPHPMTWPPERTSFPERAIGLLLDQWEPLLFKFF